MCVSACVFVRLCVVCVPCVWYRVCLGCVCMYVCCVLCNVCCVHICMYYIERLNDYFTLFLKCSSILINNRAMHPQHFFDIFFDGCVNLMNN